MYSLFGVSGAANIAIGRDGQLFGWEYIDEFCSRGRAPTAAARPRPLGRRDHGNRRRREDAWQGLRLSDLALETRSPPAISAARADMPGAGAGRAARQARSVSRGAGTARRTLCRRRGINGRRADELRDRPFSARRDALEPAWRRIDPARHNPGFRGEPWRLARRALRVRLARGRFRQGNRPRSARSAQPLLAAGSLSDRDRRGSREGRGMSANAAYFDGGR